MSTRLPTAQTLLTHAPRPTFTFDTEYGPYVWKVISKSQTKVRLARAALADMSYRHLTSYISLVPARYSQTMISKSLLRRATFLDPNS